MPSAARPRGLRAGGGARAAQWQLSVRPAAGPRAPAARSPLENTTLVQ